jgi:cobalt/nickel transport system permease protein
MVVEIPFVAFAVLMPVVSGGVRVDVLGVSLSQDGLLSGWNLLAKGTLGVVASILLAATTDARALLMGLQRLRLPARLVEIAAFMVRYVEVVAAEMHGMRVARESRAFHARHLGHLRVVAQSAGALFVRTYERGERVHLAMLSRGYAGAMPVIDARPTRLAPPVLAAALPVAALAVAWAGAVWL